MNEYKQYLLMMSVSVAFFTALAFTAHGESANKNLSIKNEVIREYSVSSAAKEIVAEAGRIRGASVADRQNFQ